ncbi:MAG TPA: hypothetical protein VFZ56_01030 [Gemmatimonadaceae bacterium]
MEQVYTLALWRVKPGREAEFIAAWRDLGEAFARLQRPPGKGTLVQAVSDPQLFYSFGPWQCLEDIEAMRNDMDAQRGIRRLMELCTEGQPGAFRVVAEATAERPRTR